jgi:hypothetical protein
MINFLLHVKIALMISRVLLVLVVLGMVAGQLEDDVVLLHPGQSSHKQLPARSIPRDEE